jgi:phage shock protein A
MFKFDFVQKEEQVMAGLTRRMSTLMKAKVSKLLDRAEDPAESLDYSYQRQLEHLQKVKKGIADVITAKKRLELQANTLEKQVTRLDTQARQALSHEREDLARAAVEQKALGQHELQSLGQQIEELERQQAQLGESEKRLRFKLETFRAKKEVIKAQYAAAEAQVRIGEAATGVGDEMADVGLAIQRAEDKTASMRARAAAIEELEAAGTLADYTELEPRTDVERELAKLDLDVQIAAELERMRAEMPSRQRPMRAIEEGPRAAGENGRAATPHT